MSMPVPVLDGLVDDAVELVAVLQSMPFVAHPTEHVCTTCVVHELDWYVRTLAEQVNFGSQICGCVGLVVGFVEGDTVGAGVGVPTGAVIGVNEGNGDLYGFAAGVVA